MGGSLLSQSEIFVVLAMVLRARILGRDGHVESSAGVGKLQRRLEWMFEST
jgi:hypothetical protein